MTLQILRVALIVLVIVVGSAATIAIGSGVLAYRYLHTVVGSTADGSVSLKRLDVIDALLSERFGQKPPVPAEKP